MCFFADALASVDCSSTVTFVHASILHKTPCGCGPHLSTSAQFDIVVVLPIKRIACPGAATSGAQHRPPCAQLLTCRSRATPKDMLFVQVKHDVIRQAECSVRSTDNNTPVVVLANQLTTTPGAFCLLVCKHGSTRARLLQLFIEAQTSISGCVKYCISSRGVCRTMSTYSGPRQPSCSSTWHIAGIGTCA